MSQHLNTQYLDLDEMKPPAVTIRYKGVAHTMKTLSVDQFIESVQYFEAMRMDGGIKQEIDITKKMISMAFPTMTPEILGEMTFMQLDAVLGIARTASNGTAGEENPPVAGA